MRGGGDIAKRKKPPVFTSTETALAVIIGPLRQKGIDIDEDLVINLFSSVEPRQRDVVYFDHKNVYETVVASLVLDACNHGGIRPIILVSDNPKYRDELTSGLSKIASVMHSTEMLPSLPYPMNRERDSSYFCKRRYNNAVINGGIEPFEKEPGLCVEGYGLDPKLAKKVCVKNCDAAACTLSQSCGYAKLISSFRFGSVKMQIYSKKQYQLSIEAERIPMRSVTIGVPAPSLDLVYKKVEYVLIERSFIDYAYLSVYHCDRAKSHRDQMMRYCKCFRKLTKLTFNKLCSQKPGSPNLQKWLYEMQGLASLIKRESRATLAKSPKWVSLHSNVSNTISALLSAEHPFDDVEVDCERRVITVRLPAAVNRRADSRPQYHGTFESKRGKPI